VPSGKTIKRSFAIVYESEPALQFPPLSNSSPCPLHSVVPAADVFQRSVAYKCLRDLGSTRRADDVEIKSELLRGAEHPRMEAIQRLTDTMTPAPVSHVAQNGTQTRVSAQLTESAFARSATAAWPILWRVMESCTARREAKP